MNVFRIFFSNGGGLRLSLSRMIFIYLKNAYARGLEAPFSKDEVFYSLSNLGEDKALELRFHYGFLVAVLRFC